MSLRSKQLLNCNGGAKDGPNTGTTSCCRYVCIAHDLISYSSTWTASLHSSAVGCGSRLTCVTNICIFVLTA